MLLREFYTNKPKLDEFAVAAAPLYPILQQLLMAGGTTLAAWLTSKALEEADIRFPNIETDFQTDIETNIDIPTGIILPKQNFDISAEEIQQYLDGVEASNLAAAAELGKKIGGGNRPPRNTRRVLRKSADIIEDVIEWIIRLIGLNAFKILVGLGLGLLAIYTIYKMTKWIASFFKSDEVQNKIKDKETDEGLDEKQVWARSGKKVVRKYRCSSGPRKNRIVAKVSQCFAAPDIKKRFQLKKVKARMGKRIARKARRTKRMNPASIRVQKLNRASK